MDIGYIHPEKRVSAQLCCGSPQPVRGSQIPLEGSIIPVVEAMFQEGFTHYPIAPGVDAALLATTAAWAVFGAARRWFQTPDRIPADVIAAKIEAMVKPLFLSSE